MVLLETEIIDLQYSVSFRCTTKGASYKIIIFLMWNIFFKSLLNLLQYYFCFIFLFLWPRGMWDLSSPTRNQTHTLFIGRQSLNDWTDREVPRLFSFIDYYKILNVVPCAIQ